MVIALFDNLAFAIEPASIAFVTPLALTLNTSELVSIELSSTPTASDTEPPRETAPPPERPSPAVTVTEEFAKLALAIAVPVSYTHLRAHET